MGFPDVPRVIYKRNPLDEVICQLRFPAILKLDLEPPATFQDALRGKFPFYRQKSSIGLPPGMPKELEAVFAKDLRGGMPQSHEFTSRDEQWGLTLTRDFLALTCRSYRKWEEFKAYLAMAFNALEACYSPSFLTRIGLRYRDVIQPSKLGLAGDWATLLNPWIAGPLTQLSAGEVEQTSAELCVLLEDGVSRVRAAHGLAPHEKSQELCYIIDADFFDERQTEITDAFTRLDFLNRQSRLFFRWCIKEKLHESMEPEPIS